MRGMTTPDTSHTAVPTEPLAAPVPNGTVPVAAPIPAVEPPTEHVIADTHIAVDGTTHSGLAHPCNSCDEMEAAEVRPTPDPDTSDDEPEPEKWQHEPDWQYDELEYKGDLLAVKIPTRGMLGALSGIRGTSADFQNKFYEDVKRIHISPASQERVITRTAEEDGYWAADEEQPPLDMLVAKLLELGNERMQKDAEALAAVKN